MSKIEKFASYFAGGFNIGEQRKIAASINGRARLAAQRISLHSACSEI
jgi:hypothetical protein